MTNSLDRWRGSPTLKESEHTRTQEEREEFLKRLTDDAEEVRRELHSNVTNILRNVPDAEYRAITEA